MDSTQVRGERKMLQHIFSETNTLLRGLLENSKP